MKLKNILESLILFLDRKKILLTTVGISVIAIYQLTKSLISGVYLFTGSRGDEFLQTTNWMYVALFLIISILAMLLFRRMTSFRKFWTACILVIFIMGLLLSFYSIQKVTWIDAKNNYELSVLAKTKGIRYLLNNYHSMAHFDRYSKVGHYLRSLHLENWAEKFINDDIPVSGMARVQPPLFPISVSFFLALFGKTPQSAVIAQWVFTILFILMAYFLSFRFSDEKTALKVAFLSIFAPTLLLHSRLPQTDIPLALFLTITVYFYVLALEKDNWKLMIIAGISFSLCILTKFTPLFLYLPFLMLALIQFGFLGGIKKYLLFTISSLILLILPICYNYYYFLNIITGRVAQVAYISTLKRHTINVLLDSLIAMTYIGLPFLIFILIRFGKLLVLKELDFIQKASLVFMITFFSIPIILFGSILQRHFVGFIPLLIIALTEELRQQNLSDKTFLFLVLITVIQVLVILLL